MELRAAAHDSDRLGVIVDDFRLDEATPGDIKLLTEHVYRDKVVVLRQQSLTPSELVRLGRMFGELVAYHEPMYHHPDESEVFVSSTHDDGQPRIGVPRTGKFWHADYQFMPRPFAFTIFAPQQLPPGNRGTFFIDMARAWAALPEALRDEVRGLQASHSVRRFFKIRPEDVYRPLGEIIDEVEQRTPAVTFPAVITHPVTGEEILYLSEGFTVGLSGGAPDLLQRLLEACGQLDPSFEHPLIRQHAYEPGDIVIWDNRTLVHRALHTTGPGSSVSFRVTALDGFGLSAEVAS